MVETRTRARRPADGIKEYIYQRLWEILSGRGTGKDDPHLAPEDRAAIVEILRETKRDLPDDWKASTSESR